MKSPASVKERKPEERNNIGDLALSASWNAFRCEKGADLVFEIKELGFNKLELSFNLTSAMVKDIESLVCSRQIEVISVHNYCPVGDDSKRNEFLPDYYAMSSNDEEERKLAVKQTKVTIDTAVRLNAKAVVLHTGRVEIPNRTRELISLYERGLRDSAEFVRLKDECMRQRQGHCKPFFENTLRSLDELNHYAADIKVSLGIETRFYYNEIPDFEEIGRILDKFKNSSLFYWHDTGHAQLMENLGFASHREFLNSYSGNMLGIHLHNISGCEDHLAPVKGDIDFNTIKPFVPKGTLKVIEAHYPATKEEVRESRVLLEKIFNGMGKDNIPP